MELAFAIGVILLCAVFAGIFSSPAFTSRTKTPEEWEKHPFFNKWDC